MNMYADLTHVTVYCLIFAPHKHDEGGTDDYLSLAVAPNLEIPGSNPGLV